EVEGDRPLVAVHVLVVRAPMVTADARFGRIVGRIDADHLGPPVGELADAGGSGSRHRQVDDPDVVERKAHGVVPPGGSPAGPSSGLRDAPPALIWPPSVVITSATV